MLSPEQLKIVEKEISKMENVEEVFNYMAKTFDLKNTKITSVIVGPPFRSGMIKAIQLLQPPLKR